MRALWVDFSRADRSAAQRWLRALRRTPWTGWALLLLGVLASGILAERFHAFSANRAAQRARWAQVAQRDAVAHRRAIAQRTAPRPPYTDDKRWQRAAAELARPWAPALQAIDEATQAPVYVLSLHTDPAAGRMQIEAEAPRFEDALAYLKPLQRSSTLSQVQLLSHEATQDPSGRSFVRFVVQTQWTGQAGDQPLEQMTPENEPSPASANPGVQP